ncbi:MAG TPA: hypothetical protein VGC56_04440 [Allosphingosinicella sp.]|jgi:hypothetical protein
MGADNADDGPKPIDPDEILGPDSDSPVDDTADRSWVRRRSPGPDAGPVGSQAMDGNFDAAVSVPQHIERVREQLGTINRFIQGRAIQRIQREHVIKLARALFDYQYQDMQHLLLLGMDVQKKRRFAQYMSATKDIQDRIQRQSAEAQLSLLNTMFDMRLKAFEAQRDRDSRIRSAYKQGGMSKEQHDRALADSKQMTDEHEQRLNETMEAMIERHSQFLFHTLSLFKTDLLTNGKL